MQVLGSAYVTNDLNSEATKSFASRQTLFLLKMIDYASAKQKIMCEKASFSYKNDHFITQAVNNILHNQFANKEGFPLLQDYLKEYQHFTPLQLEEKLSSENLVKQEQHLDFLKKYYSYQIEKLRATVPAEISKIYNIAVRYELLWLRKTCQQWAMEQMAKVLTQITTKTQMAANLDVYTAGLLKADRSVNSL